MVNIKIDTCFLLGTLTSSLVSQGHAFTLPPPSSPSSHRTNGLFMTPDEPGDWNSNTAPPAQQDYLPMGRSYYPPSPDYYGPPQGSGYIPGPGYFDRSPSPVRAPSYARPDPMGYNNGRRRVPGPGYLESFQRNRYSPQQPPPQQPDANNPYSNGRRERTTQELRQDIQTYHNGRRRSERPAPNTEFTPGLWAAENIRVRGRPPDDRNHEKRWNTVRSDNFFYLDRYNYSPVEDYNFADFRVEPTKETVVDDYSSHNSVALMMTQEQKRILIEELGFRRQDVKRLKFDKVQEIIRNRIRCPPDGPMVAWLR